MGKSQTIAKPWPRKELDQYVSQRIRECIDAALVKNRLSCRKPIPFKARGTFVTDPPFFSVAAPLLPMLGAR
jgi:hypothetical protein